MRKRHLYGKVGVKELPYLLEDQQNSYRKFLGEWVKELFAEISPIRGDGRRGLVLELVKPHIGRPHHTEESCKAKNLTYSAPLRAKGILKLNGKVIKEDELYLADIPLMTPRGTFIINGSENALVNQLIRSPGVYFTQEGPTEFRAHILPEFGAWLELILETRRGKVIANLDRKGNIPVTTLLQALGFSQKEIIKRYSFILNPLTKEKLMRYVGYQVSEAVTNSKVILDVGEVLAPEVIEEIVKAGPQKIKLVNLYIQNSLAEDKAKSKGDALGIIYRKLRATDRVGVKVMEDFFHNLYFNPNTYNLSKVGRFMLNKKLGLNNKDTVLHPEEIVLVLDRLLEVPQNPGGLDDKDHLANKRVKTPGETALDALRSGLKKMRRMTQDRLSKYSLEERSPLRSLVSARTVQSSLDKLFYTGRLSQFLEQTNPLSELTHKRRLSALSGSLSKKRAKIEVRDVHPSHYGRICPIETPEGQNIGLITTIANYARVNKYGFLESPYRCVKDGRVRDEIKWLMADEEEKYNIAPATAPLDEDGRLIGERIEVRTGKEGIKLVRPQEVHYMEISPTALVGLSASLIPFLEHNDSNRALMGANMQRQAVPLVKPQAPYVGTGMEKFAARDSGVLVVAKEDGVVTYVDANKIVVQEDKKEREREKGKRKGKGKGKRKRKRKEHTYTLLTFERSNQDTLIHQRPLVNKGDRVKKGDVLADGSCTDNGELALGANLLVGFLPWEGYNYQDAIVISERLVKEDILDSIHIQVHDVRAEETKLGPEEITADIPDISKEELRNLDEEGVIRIGTEVKTGDILVGKITPRGESEPTPEERIFRSIFGERARNVKNTSLRLPPIGEGSKVIRVQKFSRQNGDELEAGVNELVKVYIAQRKKISVGDKLAGRHGNKGVIAKILPEEDMPFLPDGRPLDILLNPLSIPSRMNLGQVLEAHLGWLAHLRGEYVASPVFDGAKEEEILKKLSKARKEYGLDEGNSINGKVILRDGRTGEPFEHPITVGYIYMLKLEHIADEKIHARSTGPYSLITQQPLGGKAQFGGQRLGEMEVWALEAYGASNILQEMLTLKSDDTRGRVQLYKAILKGEEFPKPGLPESFKVLVKELKSLGLGFKAYDMEGMELDIE
jgi:DNA-directed RNA polymerase subunit beta